jgi:hypothetical protein
VRHPAFIYMRLATCLHPSTSVDSLSRLHRRTCDVDAYLEKRGELSSTRGVWREVRDNVERGAIVLLAQNK